MALNYSAFKTPQSAYGAHPNGLPAEWDWGAWQAAQPAGTPDPTKTTAGGQPIDFTWNPNGPGYTNPQNGQVFANPRETGPVSAPATTPYAISNTGASTAPPASTQPPPMATPDPYVTEIPATPTLATGGGGVAKAVTTDAFGAPQTAAPVFRQPVFGQPQVTPVQTGARNGPGGVVDALMRRKSRWNSYS